MYYRCSQESIGFCLSLKDLCLCCRAAQSVEDLSSEGSTTERRGRRKSTIAANHAIARVSPRYSGIELETNSIPFSILEILQSDFLHYDMPALSYATLLCLPYYLPIPPASRVAKQESIMSKDDSKCAKTLENRKKIGYPIRLSMMRHRKFFARSNKQEQPPLRHLSKSSLAFPSKLITN